VIDGLEDYKDFTKHVNLSGRAAFEATIDPVIFQWEKARRNQMPGVKELPFPGKNLNSGRFIMKMLINKLSLRI